MFSCHSAIIESTSRSLWSEYLRFCASPISYLLLTAQKSKWIIYNNNDTMIINIALCRCKFLILQCASGCEISKLELSR